MKSRSRRGVAHVACTGREEVCTGLLWESLRERDHLEDAGRRWNGNIKKDLQNRGKWLALANMVMNLRVP